MKYDKDSLGTRMKGYENIWKTKLPRRMPLIARIDGKAFHTYTRDCAKPFDKKLADLMDATAKHLCENIQGSQIAYIQSDEITILIHDYKSLNSEAWFDKELQKMCSIAAATASTFFTMNSNLLGFKDSEGANTRKIALFDARFFIVPEHDVVNNFVWRQQDAVRNSIQMLARSLYSHNECNNKNQSALQEMIHQKGKNWNDVPTGFKRGRCVYKKETLIAPFGSTEIFRSKWEIDTEIPTFTTDREFIGRHLTVNEIVKENG
jgi:tRNA(His) 5'-end guanylyltransferase